MSAALPTAAIDVELMRALLLLESDPGAAAQRARAILALAPGHPEASLLLCGACRRLGDAASAVAALEAIDAAQLSTPLMQLELGRAYAAGGRTAESIGAFRRAVALDNGLAEGWRELADQLFAHGDTREGDIAYARYSELAADPPELADARVALTENRLGAADEMLRRHLERSPRDPVGLHLLAIVAARRENAVAAERWLRACLELAPGRAAARYDLAQLLHDQHRHSEALTHVARLLDCDPDNLDYLSLQAQAMRFSGRTEEAIALMIEATSRHPDNERAWLLCGHLLREAGQSARAVQMYRRALSVRPDSGRAYSSLADLKTVPFTDTDIAAMRSQLARATVRGIERIHLEFALGKALEDRAEFAESFEHYARGNALHRATLAYDRERVSADAQRLQAFFTPDFFASRRGWGSTRRDPIFIVGLPRSGSTLLEQMLASHSQVEGTRELPDLPIVALELLAEHGAGTAGATAPTYPEVLGTHTREDLQARAERYLSRTQAQRPLGKPLFVDKMLGNFVHIGLIHLMFPNAAIIDARRHPLACGFSCFKQLFARRLDYTYELSDLGRYYRDYVRLMDHFDAVLPGRVHRVYYERIVADPREELQKLLDYCWLSFEPECLRFYENRRIVQTLSSEQVRRPIYRESVDQWRHYEPWLGPLKEALGDVLDRYPAPVSTERA